MYLDIIREINIARHEGVQVGTTAPFLLGLERKVASMARGFSRGLELGPTSSSTTRNFLRAR